MSSIYLNLIQYTPGEGTVVTVPNVNVTVRVKSSFLVLFVGVFFLTIESLCILPKR